MTLSFIGALKYRFRFSIFGYDIFVGPWQTSNIDISEPIPSTSATIGLPDGFSGAVSPTADGVALTVTWEGFPLVSEAIPVAGSLPLNLQPLKGVILAGTVSVSS